MDTSLLVPLLPIDAAVAGKDATARDAVFARFAQLPEAVRFFMASLDTAKAISAMIQKGILPESHGVAVARLLAFVAFGEVTTDQVPALLAKIGVTNTAEVFQELESGALRMLSEARKLPLQRPIPPKPIPPLAIRRPVIGPPPRPPAIIDLRKTQP